MGYRYYICDVFTDTRFAGNPLAVLPEATALSDGQMQKIAREFNFSETSFVFPSASVHARKVRIFTPASEVPFAGHPNIGTAFCLATAGEFGGIDPPITVTFEEKAGLVPVAIHGTEGAPIWCELAAPEDVYYGATISAQSLASSVSLSVEDVVTATHLPQVASVGLPFVIAELRDRSALARARADLDALRARVSKGVVPHTYLYTRGEGELDIRARMFAPLGGVPEDPGTASASCALAGMLSHYGEAADGSFSWRIAQGVEMGRPCVLDARAEKRDGVVVGTWVGGACVLVSEGLIEVD